MMHKINVLLCKHMLIVFKISHVYVLRLFNKIWKTWKRSKSIVLLMPGFCEENMSVIPIIITTSHPKHWTNLQNRKHIVMTV